MAYQATLPPGSTSRDRINTPDIGGLWKQRPRKQGPSVEHGEPFSCERSSRRNQPATAGARGGSASWTRGCYRTCWKQKEIQPRQILTSPIDRVLVQARIPPPTEGALRASNKRARRVLRGRHNMSRYSAYRQRLPKLDLAVRSKQETTSVPTLMYTVLSSTALPLLHFKSYRL